MKFASLFKSQTPQKFSYQARHFDETEEARKKLFGRNNFEVKHELVRADLHLGTEKRIKFNSKYGRERQTKVGFSPMMYLGVLVISAIGWYYNWLSTEAIIIACCLFFVFRLVKKITTKTTINA